MFPSILILMNLSLLGTLFLNPTEALRPCAATTTDCKGVKGFFMDTATGNCLKAKENLCGDAKQGNKNYASVEECEKACLKPNECWAVQHGDECKGSSGYFMIQDTGKCHAAAQNLCGSEIRGNSFRTMEDCRKRCEIQANYYNVENLGSRSLGE